MNTRTAGRIAWGLWTLCMALSVGQLVLLILARHVKAAPGFGFPGFEIVLTVVFASVGAIVAGRHSSNPIGWIFVAVGVEAGVQGFGLAYALNGILGPRAPWPAAIVGAWINSWLWFPAVMTVGMFVFLLFPDGRYVSARWRSYAWICGVLIAGTSILMAVLPGPLENFAAATNPFAVRVPLIAGLSDVGFAASNLAIIGAVVSLIVRYRRAGSTQREQIKWLGYAGAVAGVALPVGDLFENQYKILGTIIILSILSIPVSIGIAVLRYRLYDIDRIISRTVAYTVVTGILVGMYALVALVPTAIIGTNNAPDGLIAAATLLAAAAFAPVRRRVQSLLDKRFNRARYDAVRTIEAFSARLRDEIDIDRLTDELREVVGQTMQPALVSVWLRNR